MTLEQLIKERVLRSIKLLPGTVLDLEGEINGYPA